MTPELATLMDRLRAVEAEVEAELAKRREELRFRIEKSRIVFEGDVAAMHRALKTGLARYLLQARPLTVITAPVVYAVIVPLVLLDIVVTIYQAICFPVYGIPKVKRRDYLIFDRHHLAYLNLLEKINCAYCSYANGLAAYVREIAARTEIYWCPIKHARRVLGPHPHYAGFADFGDAEGYRRELEELKQGVRLDDKS